MSRFKDNPIADLDFFNAIKWYIYMSKIISDIKAICVVFDPFKLKNSKIKKNKSQYIHYRTYNFNPCYTQNRTLGLICYPNSNKKRPEKYCPKDWDKQFIKNGTCT